MKLWHTGNYTYGTFVVKLRETKTIFMIAAESTVWTDTAESKLLQSLLLAVPLSLMLWLPILYLVLR